MATRIQVRRDTLANFTGVVPLLGEPIAIVGTGGAVSYKIGDGVTPAESLPALSKGDKGDPGKDGANGAQGLPGTNGVATDDAFATNLSTDGTKTQQAGDARYNRNRADLIMTTGRGVVPGIAAPGSPIDSIIAAAMVEAKTSARPGTGSSDAVGTRVIDIPAGDYTISALGGLIGVENMTTKVSGLRIRGAGKGLTRIIFSPSSVGALIQNDFWMNIGFTGITFVAGLSGVDFMRSYTTHNAQNYWFTDCEWSGPWNHLFDLQGNNNNSEFTFLNCATTGMLDTGAVLYVGATNSSDQFLNYWFYGFKHWSTAAAWIDMARGGHVHGYGVDVSDWGARAVAGGPSLINLRGATHSYGVCTFDVTGLRVEAKAGVASLLYSEWPQGNVSIQCDWSSQTPTITYGDIIKINYVNVDGAVYNFHDSVLAGGINVGYAVNDWTKRHIIRVQDTVWLQRNSPSDVVSYTRPNTNYTEPVVEFIRCRGGGSDVTSTNGYDIWDAAISWVQGDMVKPVQRRAVSVRSPNNGPNSSNTYYLNVPVGAFITSMRAIAPAGDTAATTGATWTLQTADGTATVASITVSGSRAAGYNVANELAAPFNCNTSAKAKLKLTSADATQVGGRSVVIVEGYW